MAKRREEPMRGEMPRRAQYTHRSERYELEEPRSSREAGFSRKGEMDRGRGYRQPADSNASERDDERDAPFRGAYGDFSQMGGRGLNAYPAKDHEEPYDVTGAERGNDYEHLYERSCERTARNFHNNPGGFSTGQGMG